MHAHTNHRTVSGYCKRLINRLNLTSATVQITLTKSQSAFVEKYYNRDVRIYSGCSTIRGEDKNGALRPSEIDKTDAIRLRGHPSLRSRFSELQRQVPSEVNSNQENKSNRELFSDENPVARALPFLGALRPLSRVRLLATGRSACRTRLNPR